MHGYHRIPDIPVGRLADDAERTPSGPTVLVATAFDEASDVALRRGQAMATVLEARLVVLHVVPPNSWVNILFPERHVMDAAAMQQQLLSAVETTRSWCKDVLGADAEQPAIVLKRGYVAPAILEVARDVRASLLVVGDSPGSSAGFFEGSIAATMIHKARRPVLVAREERPNKEIVAATNFADAKFPALREAARLGVRLGAHVTFLHNVDASDYVAAASLFGLPIPATVVPREPDLERRKQELEEVARLMGAHIETLLAMGTDSTEAILDVARARDADLVVVGARRRRGIADAASLGTAATVARQARRSVLAVPLHSREASGWAS